MNKKLWIVAFILTLSSTAFASAETDFLGRLTRDRQGVIITGYLGRGGAVEIPGEINGIPVREIDNGAFTYNHTITSIVVPDGVTRIGNSRHPKLVGAFAFCESLQSITLPAGLLVISAETFLGCITLTTITIPSTVRIIGARAFAFCLQLTEIALPASLETVGHGAFEGCRLLTTVTVPDSLERVRFSIESPFKGCSRLSLSSRAALGNLSYRDFRED